MEYLHQTKIFLSDHEISLPETRITGATAHNHMQFTNASISIVTDK